jgi:HK97 family phage major capsid protein
MKYSEMLAKFKADNARIIEIDEMAEITDELKAEQDGLITACESMKGKIERKKASIAADGYIADAEANPPLEKRVIVPKVITSNTPIQTAALPVADVPGELIRYGSARRAFGGRLNSFVGANAEQQAYDFGQFFRATAGVQSAMQYCVDQGMIMAVHQEGVNTLGGYLVPTEFDNNIIRLVLEYGVFRKNTRIVPMSSDKKTQPRRTGGLTGYWAGENQTLTESTMSWDEVTWSTKKLTALTRVSNELSEDNVVGLGDDIMEEIALTFATKEDTAGFNGAGESSNGGITGVVESLSVAAGGPTTTSAGGIIVSGNNTYGEITLKELHKVVSITPSFARKNAKWYCSPLVNDQVLQTLQTAAGGNTAANLAAGGTPVMIGYPVELAEVMPTTEANSQICILFGDLRKGSSLGDRRQTIIKTSEHASIGGDNVFEQDQLAIKGTERLDINVHDVGNTTTAGPIVGLQLLNA